MIRRIVYEQSARDDLRSIYFWIAEAAGSDIALAYLQRIHERCDRLVSFPERGTPRDDIVRGLRTIPFERSATIAYIVKPDSVQVLRVLRKGQDVNREFPS